MSVHIPYLTGWACTTTHISNIEHFRAVSTYFRLTQVSLGYRAALSTPKLLCMVICSCLRSFLLVCHVRMCSPQTQATVSYKWPLCGPYKSTQVQLLLTPMNSVNVDIISCPYMCLHARELFIQLRSIARPNFF